jgi:hypothetical protein
MFYEVSVRYAARQSEGGKGVAHQAKVDSTRETQVLRISPDLSVGEEEGHGEESTDNLMLVSDDSFRLSRPLTIVPLLPQNHLPRHMKPARIGLGIPQRLTMA